VTQFQLKRRHINAEEIPRMGQRVASRALLFDEPLCQKAPDSAGDSVTAKSGLSDQIV
jgi:hypothetical protein